LVDLLPISSAVPKKGAADDHVSHILIPGMRTGAASFCLFSPVEQAPGCCCLGQLDKMSTAFFVARPTTDLEHFEEEAIRS
jgi:hypothetical protein